MSKILVIDGHPAKGSFNGSITGTYSESAKLAGHSVKIVFARDLKFNPNLAGGYTDNKLESDLVELQNAILWCSHLVIVTPVWWMGVPAVMKGVLDRILTPGFAFKYEQSIWPFPRKLLTGRSARVIYTQGSPVWVTKFFMLESFWRNFKWAILDLCGFRPVKRTYMAKIVSSTQEEKKRFLRKVAELGRSGK